MGGELRELLLGRGGAEGNEEVAARRRLDADFDDAVDLVESELIDEFVAGRLAAADASAFREHFLTSEDRRSRLAMARGLRDANRAARLRIAYAIAAGLVTLALVGGVAYHIAARPETVPTIVLANNRRAGEGGADLVLSGAPSAIVLTLRCPPNMPASLLTFGRIGDKVSLITMHLPASGNGVVRLPVPTALLQPGDYIATVSAGEEFRADFQFLVAP